MTDVRYVIYWWPLDVIDGEKLWLDDAGDVMSFQDRGDACAYMHRLYQNPDYVKLGFRVAAV